MLVVGKLHIHIFTSSTRVHYGYLHRIQSLEHMMYFLLLKNCKHRLHFLSPNRKDMGKLSQDISKLGGSLLVTLGFQSSIDLVDNTLE